MTSRTSSSSITTTPHAPIAPIAPQAVHHLAAPTPHLVDATLPGYLIPQALATLAESAAYASRKRLEAERQAEGAEGDFASEAEAAVKGKSRVGGSQLPLMIEDAVAARIERIGFMVGGYIAEKLTAARPPIATHLDIIKFICKDLFLYVYAKQIDNLRTNHRGVFVLQSNAFPPLVGLSSPRGQSADIEAARRHIVFPQALVHGALSRLGMHATVTAESAQLPQCTFQIRTIKPTPPAGVASPSPSAAPGGQRLSVGQ